MGGGNAGWAVVERRRAKLRVLMPAKSAVLVHAMGFAVNGRISRLKYDLRTCLDLVNWSAALAVLRQS